MTDLLLFGDSVRSAALRHELALEIMDPLLFAEHDGQATVLTSMLERSRVAAARPDAELLDFFDLGLRDLVEDGLDREAAIREVVARAVRRLGVRRAVVPGDFPLAVADRLRADGVELVVDDGAVDARRRVKAGGELDGIRRAQRVADGAMGVAAGLLRDAAPGPHGHLLGPDGEPLLAEHVRAAIRRHCAKHDAPAPPEIIVGSVWTGTGHEPGYGPLPAGLPIQVDLWPRDEASGGWADMTRTFLVGDPAPEHAALINGQETLVREVLEEARDAIAPGVTGRELCDAASERFEQAGHRTQRTGPDPGDPAVGFQFALGHGVGLEVHEAPGLGISGREPLVAGDVVAIEPGLWDPRIGGVRFEDLLLVTEDGCETLTRYPYDLTP